MKKIILGFVTLSMLCSHVAWAATPCPVSTSAVRGSQRGYATDTVVAERIAHMEKSVSDTLGDCIGGITSVGTDFFFPSLDDLFAMVLDQVCHVASSEATSIVSNVNTRLGDIPGFDAGGIVPGFDEIRPIDIQVERNNGGFGNFETRTDTESIDWTDLF